MSVSDPISDMLTKVRNEDTQDGRLHQEFQEARAGRPELHSGFPQV